MAERSIVDIGRFLQGGGLRVREHSAFGGVTPGAHSPRGYHPHDEAIDVTDWRDEAINGQDWRQRTRAMRDRFAQLGLSEVLGPGDAGHDEHLHLALKGKKFLSDQQLLWARDGRYQDGQGQWQTSLPGSTLAAVSSPIETVSVVEPAQAAPAAPQPMDWKASASDSGRSTDPSSQAYWQRQDMRLWAQANPALAKATMARAGADASWLEAPVMTQAPQAQTPAAPVVSAPASGAGTPQAPAPMAPAPMAPKPEDRGALNGTQVGGKSPAIWDLPTHTDDTQAWRQARELAQRASAYTGGLR